MEIKFRKLWRVQIIIIIILFVIKIPSETPFRDPSETLQRLQGQRVILSVIRSGHHQWDQICLSQTMIVASGVLPEHCPNYLHTNYLRTVRTIANNLSSTS